MKELKRGGYNFGTIKNQYEEKETSHDYSI